jgi:menaquinone-dependent protoporphyrinogen oxidase
MNTLIIYATKHGSSKKCAEMLLDKLIGKVDLYNVKDGKDPDLSLYDKVIIGGSIYAGAVAKELTEFCRKNLDVLKEKKLGLYICCMNDKEAEKQINNVFPQELLNCSIVKKSFGGEFKFKEMNFFEKLIAKVVSKSLAKEDPSATIDTKKDIYMLSEESINEFANTMNKAV